MSRETLTVMLGRACLDDEFLERFNKDPAAAASEMKMKLEDHELAELKQLKCRQELKNLQECLKHHHRRIVDHFGS